MAQSGQRRDLLRRRGKVNGDAGAGGIQHINGFVRQLTPGEITFAQRCCGLQGVIINQHAVRLFIDRRQTTQNNGGFGGVGFADLHQLEAARQGGIFLEVFFVFAPGGGGDGFQFAARQRRFEQVGDIQPALLVARANQGMCFVNKQNDRHRRGNDLRHQPLEAFFEFALHRRPGLQCA